MCQIKGEAARAQRHAMIAEAAYYLAEARDFAPGRAERDWLHAERAIDALLAARTAPGSPDAGAIRHALRLQAASD